jgi:hypothetical protein
MTSLVKHSEFELVSFLATAAAILATMFVTFLCLAYARNVIERVGPLGIDAITPIVGFFVATMGGGLIFHGVVEALQDYGKIAHQPPLSTAARLRTAAQMCRKGNSLAGTSKIGRPSAF